jgi:hypothetical protein
MPATLQTAFHRAVLEFVAAPERLDEILAELEAIRRHSG